MTQETLRGVPPPANQEAAARGSAGASAGRGRDAVRLPSLTGMRGPAAVLAFFCHAGLAIPPLRLLADDDRARGFTGVAERFGPPTIIFFFVLSGFVLTWSARDTDTVTGFWRRRFVKIYPNYVITWALALVVFASSFASTRQTVTNLLMLHVWVPDFGYLFSVNPPSWSLGCELLFYLSFPLLFHLVRRIRPEHLKYWISATTAAIVTLPFFTYLLTPETPNILLSMEPANVSDKQYWFVYFLPVTRVLDFALGMLVALAVRHGRWRNIGLVWSGLLVAGAYLLSLHVPLLYGMRSTATVPWVLMIAAAAVADIEGRFSVFRHRSLIWLGNISFAFYLMHFIVLAWGRRILGREVYSGTETALVVGALLVLTVLLSWALYVLVERPVYRRWSEPRRASSGGTPAGPAPTDRPATPAKAHGSGAR